MNVAFAGKDIGMTEPYLASSLFLLVTHPTANVDRQEALLKFDL